MRVRVFGVEQNAALEKLLRLRGVSRPSERDRHVIVGHRVLRVGFQDFLEQLDRLLIPALPTEHIGQIDRCEHIARFGFESLLERHAGRGEFSGLDLGHGQVRKGEMVVRILLDDAAVDFFGIGEAAELHQIPRLLDLLARLV